MVYQSAVMAQVNQRVFEINNGLWKSSGNHRLQALLTLSAMETKKNR